MNVGLGKVRASDATATARWFTAFAVTEGHGELLNIVKAGGSTFTLTRDARRSCLKHLPSLFLSIADR